MSGDPQRREGRLWFLAGAGAVAAHALVLLFLSEAAERGPKGPWRVNEFPAINDPAPPVVALPPEPEPKPEPEPATPTSFGETGGTGQSIASLDLPEPNRSPQPDEVDQAWLRRKPMFAASASDPTRSDVLSANPTSPPPAAAPSVGLQSALPLPSPIRTRVVESSPEAPRPDLPEQPALSNAPTPAAESKDMQATQSPRSDDAKADAPEAQIAARDAPPDPANLGTSDVDPFATEEGITFGPGGVKAREGREIRLVRPRVDLGFNVDYTRLQGRRIAIKLQIETDAAGMPRNVRVSQSSGSSIIDDAVCLAMYESWFGGKAPDQFTFVVTFVSR